MGSPTEAPAPLRGREFIPDEEKRGGGSDDIGDISWNVPTVTLRFPSNMAAGPGHNWANAISMATPIAHKGIQVGAKVVALTVIDFLMKPELVTQAWDYFKNVQTKDTKYIRSSVPTDKPAIWLNKEHHGVAIPAGNEEVLLRSDQVQELPRTARDFLPDGPVICPFIASASPFVAKMVDGGAVAVKWAS